MTRNLREKRLQLVDRLALTYARLRFSSPMLLLVARHVQYFAFSCQVCLHGACGFLYPNKFSERRTTPRTHRTRLDAYFINAP